MDNLVEVLEGKGYVDAAQILRVELTSSNTATSARLSNNLGGHYQEAAREDEAGILPVPCTAQRIRRAANAG